MTCHSQKIIGATLLLACMAFAFPIRASAQTQLPGHLTPGHDCPIDNSSAASMKAAMLGKPPDNLAFIGGTDPCVFYERAVQMFLWVTSPTPSTVGKGSYVFNSPLFYNTWSEDIRTRRLAQITRQEIIGGELALDVKIEIEPGQAGEDATVLMTQDRRLVYYLVEVNDVYAYFLTGTKNGEIKPKPTEFPADQTMFDKTVEFARNHKKTLDDAKTMAVELKSAWIEADKLSPFELKKYITMEAKIPIYDQSSTTTWTQDGRPQTRKLALVGMHVVFSAKHHPEMIWATFEHINNTRNRSYTYFDDRHKQGPKGRCTESKGSWLFSLLPAKKCDDAGSFNEAVMHFDRHTRNIVAYGGETIGPSNVRRESPWGNEPISSPDDNTNVISINRQLHHLLDRHDARKDYILIGASWTDGTQPTEGNRNGTKRLLNTTMETFFKNGELGAKGGVGHCFDCHKGQNMLGNDDRTGLSHIFGVLPELKCRPGEPCTIP